MGLVGRSQKQVGPLFEVLGKAIKALAQALEQVGAAVLVGGKRCCPGGADRGAGVIEALGQTVKLHLGGIHHPRMHHAGLFRYARHGGLNHGFDAVTGHLGTLRQAVFE